MKSMRPLRLLDAAIQEIAALQVPKLKNNYSRLYGVLHQGNFYQFQKIDYAQHIPFLLLHFLRRISFVHRPPVLSFLYKK